MEHQTRSPVERASERLQVAAADLFIVNDVTLGLAGQPEAIRLRGWLQVPSHQAYPQLAERFRREGYTVYLRREPDQELDVILAVPGVEPQARPARVWVNAVLYVLTVLSTLYTGAAMADQMPQNLDTAQALLWPLENLWLGWPFALSIMTILTGHELGHYFTSRHFKLAATLPYFIPLPVISPFGTMGAVIAMKDRLANRRQMLAVGAAGPLAGLVLALPILVIGLLLSEVKPITMPQPGQALAYEGNSILYLLLKFAVFGKILPGSGLPPESLAAALREVGAALLGTFPLDRGVDVFVHQVAWAGWAGLLVTALNLLPVGQLDGGHILYSLIGQRAARLTWPIIGVCLAMGLLLWNGWLLWAGLLFLFGQGHPSPSDELTRLGRGGKVLAVLMLIVFVLTFAPVPLRQVLGDMPAAAGEGVGCLAGLVLAGGLTWWAYRRRR